MNHKLKVRCSSLSKIMSEPREKSKKNELSETAKASVREMLRYDMFGFQKFDGSKETEKGHICEQAGIELAGAVRFLDLAKNTERRENKYISGECDVYAPELNLIIDIKNSWDIGTHPFFREEALDKAKKAGYDWQMQGYMWLWDCEEAHIDFCLFPTPPELISTWENPFKYVDLVNDIPQQQRITTIVIKRDEALIEKIKDRVTLAQSYYEQLFDELSRKG